MYRLASTRQQASCRYQTSPPSVRNVILYDDKVNSMAPPGDYVANLWLLAAALRPLCETCRHQQNRM